jgi:S-adenosylmethionine:tRNA ribosyltransferase-isomerase
VNISDFDFELPAELIAQHPPANRGGSRLIVYDRATTQSQHTTFDQLPAHLTRGDLLVVNDTRVSRRGCLVIVCPVAVPSNVC